MIIVNLEGIVCCANGGANGYNNILIPRACDPSGLRKVPNQEIRDSRTSGSSTQTQKFETIVVANGYKNAPSLRLRIFRNWPELSIPAAGQKDRGNVTKMHLHWDCTYFGTGQRSLFFGAERKNRALWGQECSHHGSASHSLAVAVRLLQQSKMSSIVKAVVVYIKEGRKNRSIDMKRVFQSLKTGYKTKNRQF